MLGEFSIANFKAFAEKQRIPLKPITLVFGANSSGKSSILQSLAWVGHAFESGRLDFGSTESIRTPGDEIELGGILNVVHKKKKDGRIRLELALPDKAIPDYRVAYEIGVWTREQKMQVYSEPKPPPALKDYFDAERAFLEAEQERYEAECEDGLRETNTATVQDGTVNENAEKFGDAKLQALWERWCSEGRKYGVRGAAEQFEKQTLKPHYEMMNREESDAVLMAFEVQWSGATALRFERKSSEEYLELTEIDIDAVVDRPQDSKASSQYFRDLFWKSALNQDFSWRAEVESVAEELKPNSDLIVEFSLAFTGLRPLNIDRQVRGREPDEHIFYEKDKYDGSIREEDLTPYDFGVDFESFLTGVAQDCAKRLKDALRGFSFLGPLRTLPPRLLMGYSAEVGTSGGDAWVTLREDDEVREAVNRWMAADKLNTGYRFTSEVFAPLRSSVEALLEDGRFVEWTAKDFDLSKADFAEGFVRSNDAPQDEEPPDYSEAPEQAVKFWSNRVTGTLRNLSLFDARNDVEVTHRDVGVGISQLIPVIVHACSKTEATIAIEQPELHLHPALQAEMGDVFIESALGERKNTFLLETHSEHLILRLLRRIRETTEGELEAGQVPLRPDDVCILYVQPNGEGSEIVELPINADGDFDDPWPGGFFEERADELF